MDGPPKLHSATPDFKIEIVPIRKDSADVNFATKMLATRAQSILKNAYALLFTSGGAFTVGSAQDITFTNVGNPTAVGGRLVIVANDNIATTLYASSKGTENFAGNTAYR